MVNMMILIFINDSNLLWLNVFLTILRVHSVFRFAHLINVSFFDDLFAVMTDLVDSGVNTVLFNTVASIMLRAKK